MKVLLSALIRFATALGLLVAFFGCTDGAGDRTIVGAADPKLADEPVPAALVSANTRFAFKLYRHIVAEDTAKNVFISPVSISLALAMTYNGADGTTKEAMAEALELRDMPLDDVNQANLILLSNLAYADKKVSLAIANSLWSRENMPFYPDFMDRNRKYFGAEVMNLDFSDPKSVEVINGWVGRSTNGKIPTIIKNIPPATVLYLINAIYFKGEWEEEFDAKATRDEPFTLLDGSKKTVSMMHQTRSYGYFAGPNFQAAILPYGREGRFGLYVFLPGENSSLEELHAALTAENWERWMASFHSMEGNIGLPRFEIAYEKTLNDVLKATGMGVAFDPVQADFSRMLPVSAGANAYISEVKHKTYVKVNEEGTEAAAVTSVGISVTSAPQRFTMICDRPFFVVIRDDVSGTILFMGSVTDPTEEPDAK